MIKIRHKNNYYFVGENLWVRDFTKNTPAIGINNLIQPEEVPVFLDNEIENKKLVSQKIEQIQYEKIVIASSGYNFVRKQKYLEELPEDVAIFGVNNVINKWGIAKKLNYYIINNPFKEAISFLPNYYKLSCKCLTSTRTYPEFIKKFSGIVHQYLSTPDENYSGLRTENDYYLDDYRNPICAAIHFAYKCGVKKLLLFCCDDSFPQDRPGSIPLANGLWTYPQQLTAHKLMDGMLYWLKEVHIASHSSGPEYKHAVQTDKISEFFAK